MAYYQIYTLNAAGRIADSIDVVCPSDLEACRATRYALVHGARAEVWSGFRYVGVVSVPELKMIEVSSQRSSDPCNMAVPHVATLPGAPAPSWGRPDLFAGTDLAA